MSRVCELTGIRPLVGNKVSHSNRKARTRWLPNLVRKQYKVPELGLALTCRLSTRAIRTIDKHGGFSSALLKAKEELLSPRFLRLRRALQKKSRSPGAQQTLAS